MSLASVLPALKNTPKGRLQYSPTFDAVKLKHELDTLSPPPLTRSHKEKESSRHNLSFGLNAEDFQNLSDSNLDFNDNCDRASKKNLSFNDTINLSLQFNSSGEEKSDVCKVDKLVFPESCSLEHSNVFNKMPKLLPVTPEFGYTHRDIHDEEKKWDHLVQMSLTKRQEEFEHYERHLEHCLSQKEKEMEAKLAQQAKYRQDLIDRKVQEGLEELLKQQQKLKENHEEHQKKIIIKHKEIERKREILKEEERKKKEKLAHLCGVWQEMDNIRHTYAHQLELCQHKSRLSDQVEKTRNVLEKICSNRLAEVHMAESHPNLDELISRVEEDKEKSKRALSLLVRQIDEVQKEVEAEEKKRKELEKKKTDDAANVKLQEQAMASDFSVQSLSYIMQDYEARSRKLTEVEDTVTTFIRDVKNKNLRFSINRAVNIPINAIANLSGPHLLNKVVKLKELVQGQELRNIMREQAQKQGQALNPNTSVPADVLLFCQNLVAKMLVKKGDEEVTSSHRAAFPVSTVVVALWAELPVMGDLFMAHLQALCPYVLPRYPTRDTNQSSADYHRSLGYKVSEDGTVEEQDKFLRRMSGLMRLYASCMVAHLPPGSTCPHPHGLEHAWMWLSRTMNLEPLPDVTAAMVYDVLSVTGHALLKLYRVQFDKLLRLLHRNFLPKLESVSITSATFERLKLFLEKAMQSMSIPQPEGILPENFYTKPDDSDTLYSNSPLGY